VRTIGLTPEVHEKVREALDAGAYQRDAATFAGVSVRTFYAWLQRGREAAEALERGEPVESVDRDLAAFLHMVEGSRVRVAVDLLTVVQDAARKDWRAAAWFLERSYPEQWGKREPGKPGTSDPEPEGAFALRVDEVLAEAERRWGPLERRGAPPTGHGTNAA
jgi:hypothetical protein